MRSQRALSGLRTPDELADWLDQAAYDRHPRILAVERAATLPIARSAFPALADAIDPQQQLLISISTYLVDRLDRIEQLRDLKRSRELQISVLDEPRDRRAAILEFAAAAGATPRQVRGDRRAFRSWFELDAVVGRVDRQIGEIYFTIAVGLHRIGCLAGGRADGACSEIGAEGVSALQHALERILETAVDARVVEAMMLCLERICAAGDPSASALAASFLSRVSRCALDRSADPAARIAALSCLSVLAPHSGRDACIRILTSDEGRSNEFWVQRAAVRIGLTQGTGDTPSDILNLAKGHEKPAVRQMVALSGGTVDGFRVEAISRLCLDPSLPVRLAAVSRIGALLVSEHREHAADVLAARLADETSPVVLRLLFDIAEAEAFRLATATDLAEAWAQRFIPLLERHHSGAEDTGVRRRAAEAREGVWCAGDDGAYGMFRALAGLADGLNEGGSKRLPRRIRRNLPSEETIGRVLAVLARRDFGLSVSRAGTRAARLHRGDRFRRRLWRVIHEFLRPGTEKRQAFLHTVGRDFPGEITAPSGILAELAKTKVPGEPLFIEAEHGWRNYLPLLEHVYSAAALSGGARLYSAEGVTTIHPPPGDLRRLASRFRLLLGFTHLADLRNATNSGAYTAALRKLGFRLEYRPHRGSSADDRVSSCFSFGFLPVLPEILDRWHAYYYTIFQNTLGQLAVFLAMAIGWFVGRHFVLSRRIRRVRRAIPLVVGGWGTRGKSGTERLKAAMFNGLGYPLVSKTTGCEAMFLHSDSFGSTQELFLFRPFDKATIWEQTHVARMGRDLGSSVVLWECMGLTPEYVSILQRQWMRDDISTITNTYPDHEDLQGPAGRNIPEVMREFIPDKGVLLTTEEQMLPILREGANARGTDLHSVGWLDAAMLPAEALDQFPYDEHPSNIALVLNLADALGLDRERALRDMAERVVPDLGVLKTYPLARVGRRNIEFVNGMSANERFGALGNWRRTGFEEQDPYADPGTFLATVVNNRADRVPRSRVFAQMLVDDLMADRHILIGSNLTGFKGFVEDAWREKMASFSLRDDDGNFLGSDAALSRVRAEIRRLRVIQDAAQLAAVAGILAGSDAQDVSDASQLEAWVEDRMASDGVGSGDIEGAVAHLKGRQAELREALDLIAAVGDAAPGAAIEAQCRKAFTTWFWRKFVTIEDYCATGEDVVQTLVSEAPPNLTTRVMGLQNIKGTGLGFVYAWQAYDACDEASGEIESPNIPQVEDGLRYFESKRSVGVLERDRLALALDSLSRTAPAEWLSANAARLNALRQRTVASGQAAGSAQGDVQFGRAAGFCIDIAEGALDFFVAIRRRQIADKVYRHLTCERISRDRAAHVIQTLNAHQKGGWLTKWLQGRIAARKGPRFEIGTPG